MRPLELQTFKVEHLISHTLFSFCFTRTHFPINGMAKGTERSDVKRIQQFFHLFFHAHDRPTNENASAKTKQRTHFFDSFVFSIFFFIFSCVCGGFDSFVFISFYVSCVFLSFGATEIMFYFIFFVC